MKRPLLAAALAGVVLAGCAPATDGDRNRPAAPAVAPITPEMAARIERNPPLGPLPPDPTNRYAQSDEAAALGHRIFFDPRFSANGAVSCSTCHLPEHGFADSKPLAVGVGTGTRQAMSVLNAAHQRWLTWDGRADTMWSQAVQPFEHPLEMNLPRAQVVQRVAADPLLRVRYERAFGAPPPAPDATPAQVDAAFANIGKALAAYERRLVSGPAPYDRWWTRWRAGDPDADAELSVDARRGLVIFFGEGLCWKCHHGALFSDGEFHMLGLPGPGGGGPTDPGRYAVIERVRNDPFNAAGPHSDDPHGPQAQISASLVQEPDLWGTFRTPSLRNVGITAPYMHDGQKATLEEVVRFYSSLEGATSLDHHRELVLTRIGLSPKKQRELVAFLHALTGEAPPAPWGQPPAPEGGAAAATGGAPAPEPNPATPAPAPRNGSAPGR